MGSGMTTDEYRQLVQKARVKRGRDPQAPSQRMSGRWRGRESGDSNSRRVLDFLRNLDLNMTLCLYNQRYDRGRREIWNPWLEHEQTWSVWQFSAWISRKKIKPLLLRKLYSVVKKSEDCDWAHFEFLSYWLRRADKGPKFMFLRQSGNCVIGLLKDGSVGLALWCSG